METHPWPFHLKKSIILYLFIYYCSRGELRTFPTGEASYEMGGRKNWALLVVASVGEPDPSCELGNLTVGGGTGWGT